MRRLRRLRSRKLQEMTYQHQKRRQQRRGSNFRRWKSEKNLAAARSALEVAQGKVEGAAAKGALATAAEKKAAVRAKQKLNDCGGKLHFKAPTGRFEGSPLAACGRRGPGGSPGGRRSSSERSTRTHTHLHALTYTCQRYCACSNAWASMHARRARASHEPPEGRRGPQRPGG